MDRVNLSREDIESSPRLSPLAKYVLEWMTRRKPQTLRSTEIGKALGLGGGDVAAAALELRNLSLLEKEMGGRALPLSDLHITAAAHAAYQPRQAAAPKGKT